MASFCRVLFLLHRTDDTQTTSSDSCNNKTRFTSNTNFTKRSSTTRDSKLASSMKPVIFILLILSLLLTVSGKKWGLSSTHDCQAVLKYEDGKMMTYVTDLVSHSFIRAKEICEEIGGSLPIIHSQDTVDFLTDTLFPQSNIYISKIWLGRKIMNSTSMTTSCSTEWLDDSPVDFEMQEFGGGCQHQCNNTDCCAMYVSLHKKYYKKASFGDCNLLRAYAVCVIPGDYIALLEEAKPDLRLISFEKRFMGNNCDLKDRMENIREIQSQNKSQATKMNSTLPFWAHNEGCKSIIVLQDNSNTTILIDNRSPGATFNETLKWCSDLGGHLPMIRNLTEFNLLKGTILDLTDSSHLWLGWYPIANTTNCTSSWMDGSPAFNIANFSFLSSIQSYDDPDYEFHYRTTFDGHRRTPFPRFQSEIRLLESCDQCSYDNCCALQTSPSGAVFGSCEEVHRKVCVIPGDFMLSQSTPEATAGCNYIDIHDPVVITTTATQEPLTGINIESDDDDETTKSAQSIPHIVSNIAICVICFFLIFISIKVYSIIKSRKQWSRSPVSAEYSEQEVTLNEWSSYEPLTPSL